MAEKIIKKRGKERKTPKLRSIFERPSNFSNVFEPASVGEDLIGEKVGQMPNYK